MPGSAYPGSIFPGEYYPPTSTSSGYTLTAAAGSYALSGQAANLLKGRVLVCAAGSYALSGQAAILQKNSVLVAAAGSYTFSGQAANLLKGSALVASAGSYTFTGQAATLTYVLTVAAVVYPGYGLPLRPTRATKRKRAAEYTAEPAVKEAKPRTRKIAVITRLPEKPYAGVRITVRAKAVLDFSGTARAHTFIHVKAAASIGFSESAACGIRSTGETIVKRHGHATGAFRLVGTARAGIRHGYHEETLLIATKYLLD